MAPFTVVADGDMYPWELSANCVGPLYGGSELLVDAVWVTVLSGHCTRNDCPKAGSAHRLSTAKAIPARVLHIRPPPRLARRARSAHPCVQAQEKRPSPREKASAANAARWLIDFRSLNFIASAVIRQLCGTCARAIPYGPALITLALPCDINAEGEIGPK